MNLHENTKLFAELLTAASQPEERGGLGIRQAFLEKDYWVTRSLQILMACGRNLRRYMKRNCPVWLTDLYPMLRLWQEVWRRCWMLSGRWKDEVWKNNKN